MVSSSLSYEKSCGSLKTCSLWQSRGCGIPVEQTHWVGSHMTDAVGVAEFASDEVMGVVWCMVCCWSVFCYTCGAEHESDAIGGAGCYGDGDMPRPPRAALLVCQES